MFLSLNLVQNFGQFSFVNKHWVKKHGQASLGIPGFLSFSCLLSCWMLSPFLLWMYIGMDKFAAP